ncbi:MAG: type II CRISPR-associated endonuclease Cas1 [Muribaculaceae bacterium]|nr:type II CRISPR-associated endonuclease Cas1 [Muribaculaceae bacterium]
MIKKTLYFGNPAYLSLKNAQMVFSVPDGESPPRTFPIEDLGIVILDNRQITITHGLMERLLDNNCAVITCDSAHMPTGLFLPLDGNTLQSERFRAQIDSSKPLKKQLWQQTVKAKIANQARALNKCVPGCETGNMAAWAAEVRSDDNTNLEGRAAAYYWRNFFPEQTDFRRDRESDGANTLLNYGYAILRAVVARALVGSGLLPTLGIHHHNRYNAYCLADDVMEPYRPFVDVLVKDIVRKHGTPEELTTELKRELLSIPVIDVNISRKKRPLMVAVEITTASLAKCFMGQTKRILYPTLQ